MARTILIVDDNIVNRKMLNRILQADYTLLEAENGQEALKLLTKHHQTISAMLLDIVMPVMDGYELLRRMMDNPTLAQIPVIVLTADKETGAERKAFVLGANDYVTKPFDPDIIKRRLDNLIKLRETAAMVNTLQKDRLTGVWNRETFFQKATWEIQRKPEGYFMMGCVDIDNFKIVNDQYGAQKGDEALIALAKTLKKSCEEVGGICGRIMADNFVSLYPRKLLDDGIISHKMLESGMMEGSSLPLTLSVGRYIVDDKTLTVSAMYDRANLAKETVKGRYDTHVALYNESMREHLVREQEIVNSMGEAMKLGQFEAWYQPQYNHATGALIGAEALARWRHPTWGMVSPGEFIPVFERNGFVYELDKFIWEEACKNLRRWLDEGRNPMPISVNVSRYDLFCPDLVEVIVSLTTLYRIPEELLRLEITESAFAKSTEQVVSIVQKLIGYGFTIEVDDFGSGYSSLNTLKDVPAQIIKLDMNFLKGSDNLDRGGNIVESIVRMAKWIGMSVIAEGVETVAQADFLKSVGCNYIQGYLYSRPIPLCEYEKLAKGVSKEERLITLETVENLDNGTFWNPESVDTLIFNSYVGAACVFTYKNKTIEMIRVTDRFMDMLGSSTMTVADALRLDWSAHLDKANARKLDKAVECSQKKQIESVGDYEFRDLPGCPPSTFLRGAFRVIATVGDSRLVYNVIENTTQKHVAEQKERDLFSQISAIMNNVSDGISAAVMNGRASRYIFANEQFYHMLGYTREQFDAERLDGLSDIIHPDDFDMVLQSIRANEKARGTTSLEFRVYKRDGSLMWMHTSSTICRLQGVKKPVHITVHSDVTVQRDMERKLRENNERILSLNRRMQTLMDDTPGGFVQMKLLSNHVVVPIYANQGFCELLGIPQSEIADYYGKDSLYGVHPDDVDEVRETLSRLVVGGPPQSVKYRLRHGDSDYVPVMVSARATRNVDGDTLLNTYYTDLSAQEKRDMGIRETMPFVLEAIMSSSNDFAFAKDRDFRYLCCSPAFLRIAGLESEKDVVGKTDFDLFPQEMAKQFRQNDELLYSAGEPLVDFDEVVYEGNGAKHYCRASKYVLRDSTGRIIGLYGSSHDITEERDTLERLKLVTESVPGGIATYVLSPKGIEITYFNDGFCKMIGCTRAQYEALAQKSVTDRVFASDLPELMAQVEALRKTGAPVDCTYRNYRVDGEGYVWINICAVQTERRGDAVICNAVLYDVTKLKQAEQRLGETNEQLHAIMRNINGGVAAMTIEGGKPRYLFTNDQYSSMFGYTREQFAELKGGVADIVDKRDADMLAFSISSNETAGTSSSVNFRVNCRDGSVKWVQANSSVCSIEGVDSPVHVSVLYDVTQERNATEQLNTIIGNIASGITVVIMGKDGKVRPLLLSDNHYKLLGYTREQFQSELKSPFDPINREDLGWVMKRIREVQRTGKPDTLEFRAICRDGREIWLRDEISMIRFIGEDEPAQLSVFTDITTTRETSERLRVLADNISGGLVSYVITPEAVKATYYNEGFCNMLGFSREEYDEVLSQGIMSRIFDEDRPEAEQKLRELVKTGEPQSAVLRIHDREGDGYKWISIRGNLAQRHGDVCYMNAVVTDVTERQHAIDRLSVSEEEYRLAIETSGRSIYRYHHSDDSLDLTDGVAKLFDLPKRIFDVPESLIRTNCIARESLKTYRAFYAAIKRGDASGKMTIRRKVADGSWHWFRATFSNISDKEGRLVSAIITFHDVTKQQEREAMYARWEQSIEKRDPETYTLYRWNLNTDEMQGAPEGELIRLNLKAGDRFDTCARKYAASYVHPDDRMDFIGFASANALLANFHRGKTASELDYRETRADGAFRWFKLTAELMEYPDTTDVCAYLMFEDVDETKRAELNAREQAELDPLTGVMNRAAFIKRLHRESDEESGLLRALLMLDVDGFKQLNDTFGHAAGDQALIDIAATLRKILRPCDMIGRLGGDEFLVCLRDMPSTADIEKKVKQISVAIHKAYSMQVQLSASIGVAVSPRDGDSFDTLYKKADIALYSVKNSGKDSYAFYEDGMESNEPAEHVEEPQSTLLQRSHAVKRRMLIVDDNAMDLMLLEKVFAEDFTIEKVKDGKSALIRMRHYGSAIAVVLLDLIMPGMDGFEVLDKMRANVETQNIPVIVVSGSDDREAWLAAIRHGATDFVGKPVDPEIIQIRVRSAISKADNERLRAQNSFLSLQSNELSKYRAVLESEGTVTVEIDWKNGVFTYDLNMERHLAGHYDTRRLWLILLSDFVADANDVKRMQWLVHDVANDRKRMGGTLSILLKTPEGAKHRFRMNVIKLVNEFGLTDKIILTFTDLDADIARE